MSGHLEWLLEFFRIAHQECSREEWSRHKLWGEYRVDISELFHVAALRGFQKHCEEFLSKEDMICWERYKERVWKYINLVRQDTRSEQEGHYIPLKRFKVYKELRNSCVSVPIGRAASWAYYAGLHLEKSLGLRNLYCAEMGRRNSILRMLEWARKHPAQRGELVSSSGLKSRYESLGVFSGIELSVIYKACRLVDEDNNAGLVGGLHDSGDVERYRVDHFVNEAAHMVLKEGKYVDGEHFSDPDNLSERVMDLLGAFVDGGIKDVGLSVWNETSLGNCRTVLNWAGNPGNYPDGLRVVLQSSN